MVYEVQKKWGDNQTKEDEVTCSLVANPYIFLGLTARQKIVFLIEEYTNREWIAYLVGNRSEEGHFVVNDISVPPHKESHYTSAEAEPMNIPANCIGIVHSHHSMAAFHSSIDQTYVDKNFPVSIVVAKSTDGTLAWDAVSIQDTPCGKTVSHKGIVKYIQPEPLFDTEAWLKEAMEQIDKGKETTIVYGYQWNKETDKEVQGALPETTVPKVITKEGWKNSGEKGKKTYSRKQINKLRHKIFETRKVMLTKGQVENILEANPYAFQGMVD